MALVQKGYGFALVWLFCLIYTSGVSSNLAGRLFLPFNRFLCVMGIQGLLTQLDSITLTKTLSCYEGRRVGIDIMCWLLLFL